MKLTIPPFRSMHLLHGLLISGAFWIVWTPLLMWLMISSGHWNDPEIALLRWALWMTGFIIVPFLALIWDFGMTAERRIRS